MTEIWKPIEGFDNYQISNMGNVKSLSRIVSNNARSFLSKERILKPSITRGYYSVTIWNNGKSAVKCIHKLVAIAFLNHKTCGFNLVVNHKDFNKLNNNVNNLEIVTNRENTNRKHVKSSSQYTGVYWHKKGVKWVSSIVIDGKLIYLGSFKNEIDAHNAYQNKLKEIL